MTIKAESESTGEIFKVTQFPEILPFAENIIIDNVESDVVVLDPNSVRVEHYKVSESDKYVCGRSPILHREQINEENLIVVFPTVDGETVRAKIIWERDPLSVIIKNKIFRRR